MNPFLPSIERPCGTILASLILAFFFPLPAAAETVRVLVMDGAKSATFRSAEGMEVDGVGKRAVLTVKAGERRKGSLRIRPRGARIQLNNTSYRGMLEVREKSSGGLQVINELGLEEYLKGVVAAEIPHDWHAEALKAQAVASRTYALYQKRQSSGRPYHLAATVDSQVYLGIRGERPSAVKAVNATAGEVLRYRGQLIAAYYHSSCGGHTEDGRELWGIDAPYLCGVDCDCQRISKYGVWEKRFSREALLRSVRREGYEMADVQAVSAGEITPAGRVKRMLFRSDRGTISVPSEVLRAALGYGNVPSTFFEPEFLDGELVLSGRGLGHGVGLCQWGAQEQALRGRDYRAILRYYYPGAETGK